MASKREDHLAAQEESAKRSLEQMGRRWPWNPWVYLIALLAVSGLLLLVLWQ